MKTRTSPARTTCPKTVITDLRGLRARGLPLLCAALLLLPELGAKGAAVLTTLHSFQVFPNGAYPYAGLVLGSDGNLYGTTVNGGTSARFGADGWGTVFRISPNGALTSLCSFAGNDGAKPYAGLVQGSDGCLYGTTRLGGAYPGPAGYGNGTIYRISPDGALASLYSFTGTNDGGGPTGLMQGSDGDFYGTTGYGGTNLGYGTVFKITTNGALTTLYSFGTITNSNKQALDGGGPGGALVQGSDGSFYGTTYSGGTSYSGLYGTVFRISPNGAFSSLYSFTGQYNADGSGDGIHPSGLVLGSDGYLYGTARGDDDDYYGTIFRISTSGALTTLYWFTGGNDGADPEAGLVQGSDGNFYGTTYDGGASGSGTVFRLSIMPELQAMTLTNGTLNLTWTTEAGGTYQLQYSSDLTSGNWVNLGHAITATGATLSATDSVTNGPQRFYRLVLSP